MELCTSRAFSNLPRRRFLPAHPHLPSSITFQNIPISRRKSGLLNFAIPFLRATTSEGDSSVANGQFENASTMVSTLEESSDEEIAQSDSHKMSIEVPKEESRVGEHSQIFEYLNKLKAKLDLEDKYSVAIYGSGALIALWLTSAVVGAVDSIPVFPKVLEIVGLSYTIWFSSRYLLFKKNRDELSVKIEELKQEIIGSSDE